MSPLRSDLIVRILCDRISLESGISAQYGTAAEARDGSWGALDAAYLFAETVDNEHSVFETALRIHREGLANRILVCASEPKSGYPGFGPWYTALRQMGVPEDMILGVPVVASSAGPHASLHTLSEAQGLIAFCKLKNFIRIGVVAPPFHQLRAFLSTVSVAAEAFRGCRVYNIPGVPLPWDEAVVHSQGVEMATRFEFIERELERIDRYREKGDLISDEMLLAYFQNRDAHD